ncbi:LuxR C-terminal-related transcriptional regulator [Gemmatimonas sp.]|uniref:LuxR C-terminal-related transcriptional regulator n=1 Tax=Gemmatimonas sp. TaxID=1962908 RepID=UPI00333E77A6
MHTLPLRPMLGASLTESTTATPASRSLTPRVLPPADAALMALMESLRQQQDSLQLRLVQALCLQGRMPPLPRVNLGLQRQFASLTRRQREVLSLVVDGYPNKRIACSLEISQRTVETHRAAVMRKTECASVSALARWKMAIDDAHT